MIIPSSEKVPLEKCPALVLNADFRPLSYYPLSLWSWQDAIKAVFLDRVNIVSSYDRAVHSPSFEINFEANKLLIISPKLKKITIEPTKKIGAERSVTSHKGDHWIIIPINAIIHMLIDANMIIL